jgi:hypothetical protein
VQNSGDESKKKKKVGSECISTVRTQLTKQLNWILTMIHLTSSSIELYEQTIDRYFDRKWLDWLLSDTKERQGLEVN